jgi:hypothetical protein
VTNLAVFTVFRGPLGRGPLESLNMGLILWGGR